ncbi:MAG TPA: TIR domain-containing protein, partial [Ktedonobacteraceae bacterium]|nr:TIR domain-containing protein [Ktedonobacteraceae bacterium]
KPSNIMLTHGGRIKLIDFGIARIFRPSGAQDTQPLGTPGFAPPEQYGNAQTDRRSDIYSLAITLFQLMSASVNETGFGLKDVYFTYPWISYPVACVLEKATALKPEDRYESIVVFRRVLLGISTFRFENGSKATSPDELAGLSSYYPEEAANYLSSGEIESWLQEIGEAELARAARRIRQTVKNPEIGIRKLLQVLPTPYQESKPLQTFPTLYQEKLIYLEPDEGWTSMRERLQATPARFITLIIPTWSSFYNLAGWKLISTDIRLQGKTLFVISADRKLRSVAQAAGLSVAESREELQQSTEILRKKRHSTSLKKKRRNQSPGTPPLKRSRRFVASPQQSRFIGNGTEHKDLSLQVQQPETLELGENTISLFTERDRSISASKSASLEDLPAGSFEILPPSTQKTKLEVLKPYQVFLCYAREDEKILDLLRKHLKALQRQHYIEPWYDRDISAGSAWEKDIDEHLQTADIILLLVSPDFMASDYCYGVEVEKAMDRHHQGEAIVVPVILRHTFWKGALFGDLQALPEDAKPIFGPDYPYPDKAFLEVTEGILRSIQDLEKKHLKTIDKGEDLSLEMDLTKQSKREDLDRQESDWQRRHTWEG